MTHDVFAVGLVIKTSNLLQSLRQSSSHTDHHYRRHIRSSAFRHLAAKRYALQWTRLRNTMLNQQGWKGRSIARPAAPKSGACRWAKLIHQNWDCSRISHIVAYYRIRPNEWPSNNTFSPLPTSCTLDQLRSASPAGPYLIQKSSRIRHHPPIKHSG